MINWTKKLKYTGVLALIPAMMLTGCASVTSGTHQRIRVITSPVKGAHCRLKNNRGVWTLNRTPMTIRIHRSNKPLYIRCAKGPYYGRKILASGINAMTAGNVLAGGIVGVAIDAADDAAYHYPSAVIVHMRPHYGKTVTEVTTITKNNGRGKNGR